MKVQHESHQRTHFYSIDAHTGEAFGEPHVEHTISDLEKACSRANQAFDMYRATSASERARFLEQIAQEIQSIGDKLVTTAMRETGLPRSRLEGERTRTIGQLRLFGNALQRGDWLGVRVDPPLPDRQPLPRADLRLRKIPIGPVAVFSASNFPLAFSTAGGDTAAALAAGCPVIVKGHPAHPATGALVAEAVLRAVQICAMPAGIFSFLCAPGYELGRALTLDARIAAVSFTGSRRGGLALLSLAQQRPTPIPVYAEMSSINPVVLLPAALKSRASELGKTFVASLTMSSGQFCTNPGLIIAVDGESLGLFIDAARQALGEHISEPMLSTSICKTYKQKIDWLLHHADTEIIGTSRIGKSTNCAPAMIFTTSATVFIAECSQLGEEVFGASSLIVKCRNENELKSVLAVLEGQLTATLQMDTEDEPLALQILPLLERKVGRILANGWPTGVEVCDAMVHGGPYPATSDGRTTSVGSLAIERFLRPISYQNIPANLLPSEIQDNWNSELPCLIDGILNYPHTK